MNHHLALDRRRQAQLQQLTVSALRQLGGPSSQTIVDQVRYTIECALSRDGSHSGELLLRHVGIPTEEYLHTLKDEGRTFYLFQAGLVEAFKRIARGEVSGTISLNAFIADIGSGDLKKRVANIMKNFKQDDPRKILIEIVEAPYGSMNDQFFANIAWLKEKGFRFVVDDYDILATKTDDISRELFERIKNSCDRIKLDHHVSRMLLDGDSTALAALASFKKDNPNVHITAEGEHTIGSFILLPRIDAFQFFDNERRGRGNQSLH